MKCFIRLAFFFVSTLGFSVTVEFHAQVPRPFWNTQIYLTGNVATLGQWRADAVRLQSYRNGRFSAVLEVPANTEILYKATLGDWKHAETYQDGSARPNHGFKCSKDCIVDFTVANFELHALHPIPKDASPSVVYHHEFYFDTFNNYRSIAIYLPPQYFTEPTRRFPVLYALDGNDLFDRATMYPGGSEWNLDETLDRLNKAGTLPPFIVVGIYNTDRRSDEFLQCRAFNAGGFAADYGRFILDTIKPFADKHYRTLPNRENTFLMGSSFGGSFTLFGAMNLGEHFSRFIAMSPGLFWANHCQLKALEKGMSPLPLKVWIDMGDKEGTSNAGFVNGVQEVGEAYDLMIKAGLIPGQSVVKYIDAGALHHEKYWGARIERALRFILNAQNPKS